MIYKYEVVIKPSQIYSNPKVKDNISPNGIYIDANNIKWVIIGFRVPSYEDYFIACDFYNREVSHGIKFYGPNPRFIVKPYMAPSPNIYWE